MPDRTIGDVLQDLGRVLAPTQRPKPAPDADLAVWEMPCDACGDPDACTREGECYAGVADSHRTKKRHRRKMSTFAVDELHTVKGIEIFRVGQWNGDEYSIDDLDAMVEAFGHCGFRPPVKLGHDEKSGDRAWGWVSRIYRKGEVLLADLVDVPGKIHDIIREHGFDTVSSEIYWNLNRGGKKFRRCLKAIALLGAEIPAVSGLAPLRTVVHQQQLECDRIGHYALRPSQHDAQDEEDTMLVNFKQRDDASNELIELARDYQFEHPELKLTFSEALARVSETRAGAQALHRYHAATVPGWKHARA